MKRKRIAPDQLSVAQFEALRNLRSPNRSMPIHLLHEFPGTRLARMHRGGAVLTTRGRELLASGSFKLWRSVA